MKRKRRKTAVNWESAEKVTGRVIDRWVASEESSVKDGLKPQIGRLDKRASPEPPVTWRVSRAPAPHQASSGLLVLALCSQQAPT